HQRRLAAHLRHPAHPPRRPPHTGAVPVRGNLPTWLLPTPPEYSNAHVQGRSHAPTPNSAHIRQQAVPCSLFPIPYSLLPAPLQSPPPASTMQRRYASASRAISSDSPTPPVSSSRARRSMA